ncbi:hypothetical protein [Virgibacillus halodenitrificans]|uniref:hypothetical protein n=1 Tax=Virgibacillus halodenitrificans TaxID=1482 RepID=UPI002DB82AB9|nr:hypothetical protein [Virgibacillus halodenitrificans]MEC2159586.1 hypothetical protein [Virgibacillus halodenitrificans]
MAKTTAINQNNVSKKRLVGLLNEYQGSAYNIIQASFPNTFNILDFKRLPNRFWYDRQNRIDGLPSYCKRYNLDKESIAKISRAHFHASGCQRVRQAL